MLPPLGQLAEAVLGQTLVQHVKGDVLKRAAV